MWLRGDGGGGGRRDFGGGGMYIGVWKNGYRWHGIRIRAKSVYYRRACFVKIEYC